MLTRAALAYLALTGIVVGVWAYGFPRDFYASFPGFGRSWVSVDGPFNGHLIRDVGAAYLMVGMIAAVSLLRPAIVTPLGAGLATLAFNVPHLLYHVMHLGVYDAVDKTLNILVLGMAVLCSAWLVFYGRGRAGDDERRG